MYPGRPWALCSMVLGTRMQERECNIFCRRLISLVFDIVDVSFRYRRNSDQSSAVEQLDMQLRGRRCHVKIWTLLPRPVCKAGLDSSVELPSPSSFSLCFATPIYSVKSNGCWKYVSSLGRTCGSVALRTL